MGRVYMIQPEPLYWLSAPLHFTSWKILASLASEPGTSLLHRVEVPSIVGVNRTLKGKNEKELYMQDKGKRI